MPSHLPNPVAFGREVRHARWGAAAGVGALVGSAYFLGAWVGVHGTVMPEGIAILWPPNALLLAALLVLEPRRWWPCFPAVVVAEILADHGSFSLTESLAFALINIGEAVATASLLRRMVAGPFDFARFKHVLAFGAIGLALVPAIAAVFGATVYTLSRGEQTSFLTFWRVWWFGDALGLLILTPAAWSLADRWQRPGIRLDLRRKLKGLAMIAATAVAGHWAFSLNQHDLRDMPITPFVVMPIIAFAGAHLGIRVAAWSGVALAIVSIVATLSGSGPYSGANEVATALQLQEYLTVTVFSALALAALVAETRQQQAHAQASEEALREANEALERRVAERTADLVVANAELERLAERDGLTGTFNRRHFMQASERELDRARRYSRPLSVVLWDLDHFKQVNDTYGHLIGDAVLCAAVHRALSVLRDTDVLARYGGEEFVILLPETSADSAVATAERIRVLLSSEPLNTAKGPVKMSASFGVAELERSDSTIQPLLERADQALYQAKDEGRDRVRQQVRA